MRQEKGPLVSVVVPCRNESGYIRSFLANVMAQEAPRPDESFEVLVADGSSDDGTREEILRVAQEHSIVKLIDNPERIVSTGLNRAIGQARGEFIVRMDVHTNYAADYVRKCVEVIDKVGADNVGGAARTRADSYIQMGISIAYHSPFSSGGVKFHDVHYEGYTDTVTYGCWRKRLFDRIGLFDENLVRNQDDELNLRIIRSGGRIWQSREIKSWYFPRDSLSALFMQYAQYGYWKVMVIKKHKLPASLRHLVPGGFVLTLLILSVLSFLHTYFLWAGLSLFSVYGLASLIASVSACRPNNWKYVPIMPFVFAAYHFGYGYGFLRGVLDFGLLRRGGRGAFCDLSRGPKQ